METNLDHILIFRTNIGAIDSNTPIYHALENHPAIAQWSIDCEDTDCVLRVVSETLRPNHINQLVRGHGFDCNELD